jgi:hypothetical protein
MSKKRTTELQAMILRSYLETKFPTFSKRNFEKIQKPRNLRRYRICFKGYHHMQIHRFYVGRDDQQIVVRIERDGDLDVQYFLCRDPVATNLLTTRALKDLGFMPRQIKRLRTL